MQRKKKQPFLLVLVGYSGAGKTTTAEEIAKKYDTARLREDDFVFSMNPYSLIGREARAEDRKIGMKNLFCVLENYLEQGKSVVVEGALVDPPARLSDFEKRAKQNKYRFVPVMLVADRKKCVKRKKKKKAGFIVPDVWDRRLRKAAEDLGFPEKCTVIDTTKMKLKDTLERIEELVDEG